jgi:hypothetical protein
MRELPLDLPGGSFLDRYNFFVKDTLFQRNREVKLC